MVLNWIGKLNTLSQVVVCCIYLVVQSYQQRCCVNAHSVDFSFRPPIIYFFSYLLFIFLLFSDVVLVSINCVIEKMFSQYWKCYRDYVCVCVALCLSHSLTHSRPLTLAYISFFCYIKTLIHMTQLYEDTQSRLSKH